MHICSRRGHLFQVSAQDEGPLRLRRHHLHPHVHARRGGRVPRQRGRLHGTAPADDHRHRRHDLLRRLRVRLPGLGGAGAPRPGRPQHGQAGCRRRELRRGLLLGGCGRCRRRRAGAVGQVTWVQGSAERQGLGGLTGQPGDVGTRTRQVPLPPPVPSVPEGRRSDALLCLLRRRPRCLRRLRGPNASARQEAPRRRLRRSRTPLLCHAPRGVGLRCLDDAVRPPRPRRRGHERCRAGAEGRAEVPRAATGARRVHRHRAGAEHHNVTGTGAAPHRGAAPVHSGLPPAGDLHESGGRC